MKGKIRRAVDRRAAMQTGDTDALRMVDGSGDGLEGLVIDAYKGRWLVQTKGERPGREVIEGCLEFCESVWWKRLDQDVKLAPVVLAGEEVGARFLAKESGVSYWCDFSAGYSQGIFLDQRLNREAVGKRGAGAVLNLFSYTCGFSVAAALGGAVTTSLDLSQPYLDWGKENLELNGVDAGEHYFCKGDALRWLERWAKSGRRFRGVVADPPTFSRNEKGKVWRVERDYGDLVESVAGVVEPGGWALFCTNFRGVGVDAFEGIVAGRCGRASCRSVGMPPEYRGERFLKSVWVDFA
ncbi:MAG: class I SAM-dependent methyltransferase [Verrucomicrobiales bacterium]|nr:class I SAM-dependent methyltransferase [Verrucomicrobiales bacterium]